MTVRVHDEAAAPVDDLALERLLRDVYVGGAFTEPEVAAVVFAADAVRARGRLLCAWSDGALVGTVVLVPADSAARRLGQPDEAELHLLAVSTRHRGLGIGRALVGAGVETARRDGYRGIVLWTQPTMLAAHALYEQAGFTRSPAEDFARGGRTFRVYRQRFGPPCRSAE